MFFPALILGLSLINEPFVSASRLISSVVVSRHGTRAPNPVVSKLCPNDLGNLKKYEAMDISPAGLTANGMKELHTLGAATRFHYSQWSFMNTPFLSSSFENDEIFIQAVAEDRTLQSAIAWGQALYPPQSTPGYIEGLPPPLPVYSIPNGQDNLLEARKAACKKKLKDQAKQWDEQYGAALWQGNEGLLNRLGTLCGVSLKDAVVGSGDNYGDAIKDITDALMFDYQEHFNPLKDLTLEEFSKFRTIAITQLLGRILGTPEQVSYMNGELPDTIISNFEDSVNGGLKVNAYHGHREMMYAIAAYFNIDFNITFPGLPFRAIPPATTLFFELYQHTDSNKAGTVSITTDLELKEKAKLEFNQIINKLNYKPGPKSTIAGNTVNLETPVQDSSLFVRLLLWVPCYEGSTISDGAYTLGSLVEGSKCPLTPLSIPSCDGLTECPLEKFISIIQTKTSQVGDYSTLCKEESSQAQPKMVQNLADQTSLTNAVSFFSIACSIFFVISLTLLAVVFIQYRNRKSNPSDSQQPSVGQFNETSSLLIPNKVKQNYHNQHVQGYRSEDSLP